MSSRNEDKEIVVTDFTPESAKKFRQQVIDKSSQDPDRPIIVHISSYGGYVDALASMVETLESVPNKIVTVCTGYAFSCGAILLSFGDYRFCGKHSRIMVHEVSGGAFGDTHDVYTDAAEQKRINEYWLGKVAKNCGFSSYSDLRKHIKSKDGRNIWLDADAALEFGIIDYVGNPSIEETLTYAIIMAPNKTEPKRRVSKFSQKHSVKKKTTKKKTTKKKTKKR